MVESTSLSQIARLFLRLGIVSFGGPASHLAMMEDEVVTRRRWLTHEQFLDLLGATNLIPGPNSTEMTIHIGYTQAGWRGLLVAGGCFILPATIITLLLSHLYVRFGTIPQVGSLLLGIKPAVIAIIGGAVFRLSRVMVKQRLMIGIGIGVLILNILRVGEIVLLLSAGLIGILWENRNRLWNMGTRIFASGVILLTGVLPVASASARMSTPTLTGLGIFFLKIGSVLYGSGYVLVAFLQGGLVEGRHWLTQTQLLDAIAMGQITPGPVLSTATFVGYVVLGLPGAAVATAGIFLPSFVFVRISSPWIPKLRRLPATRGFLNGVNAGAWGLMASVAIHLAMETLTHPGGWLIFAVAAVILFRWNVNSAWIVLGSALAGWGLGQI